MRYRRGFSLVELSIVLVILGLLVGGILAGQSLIRASELRSVGTEYQRYQVATNAFRDKYFGLPGDISNATAFWGAADGNDGLGGDCATVGGTSATCNGSADGFINYNANEIWRYWQQLALAGLIEGVYTGIYDASCSGITMCAVPGSNVPASKLGGAGWTMSTTSNEDLYFPNHVQLENTLFFGTKSNYTTGNALLASEAWNLDTKLDDGRPAYGLIRSFKASWKTECVTDSTVDATYKLNSTVLGCALMLRFR